MLLEQQVVIEAGPGCKEYFLGFKRKKKTLCLLQKFSFWNLLQNSSPAPPTPRPRASNSSQSSSKALRHWLCLPSPSPHWPPAGLSQPKSGSYRMKCSWACLDCRRRKENGRTRERGGWVGSLPQAGQIHCLHGCPAPWGRGCWALSSFW